MSNQTARLSKAYEWCILRACATLTGRVNRSVAFNRPCSRSPFLPFRLFPLLLFARFPGYIRARIIQTFAPPVRSKKLDNQQAEVCNDKEILNRPNFTDARRFVRRRERERASPASVESHPE